jgi:hypothetical protein
MQTLLVVSLFQSLIRMIPKASRELDRLGAYCHAPQPPITISHDLGELGRASFPWRIPVDLIEEVS